MTAPNPDRTGRNQRGLLILGMMMVPLLEENPVSSHKLVLNARSQPGHSEQQVPLGGSIPPRS